MTGLVPLAKTSLRTGCITPCAELISSFVRSTRRRPVRLLARISSRCFFSERSARCASRRIARSLRGFVAQRLPERALGQRQREVIQVIFSQTSRGRSTSAQTVRRASS